MPSAPDAQPTSAVTKSAVCNPPLNAVAVEATVAEDTAVGVLLGTDDDGFALCEALDEHATPISRGMAMSRVLKTTFTEVVNHARSPAVLTRRRRLPDGYRTRNLRRPSTAESTYALGFAL